MSNKVSKFTVFTACDSSYFIDHALTLIKSCSDLGYFVHVHVINPNDRVQERAEKLENDGTIRYTNEVVNRSDRTYYACSRFLMLPYFIRKYDENYLVVDTDSFFIHEIPIHEDIDIGIMVREPKYAANNWEKRGMKVAAGLLYVGKHAIKFSESVKRKLVSLGTDKWFVDQVALYEAFEETEFENIRYFDTKDIDWEFSEKSSIWTGKGPRKHKDKKYIAMKEKIGTV